MTSIAAEIAETYALGHRKVLDVVADLGEEQMRWRAHRSNSIAFNLWHIARWADHMQSVLPTITPRMRERLAETTEIWQREGVASKWGLTAAQLGHAETGMGMDEGYSATLELPKKDLLVSYAKRTFDAAESAVGTVRDEDLAQPAEFDPARVPWTTSPADYRTVANWLIAAISHDSRHIGMVEALKGAAGLRGTASR